MYMSLPVNRPLMQSRIIIHGSQAHALLIQVDLRTDF